MSQGGQTEQFLNNLDEPQDHFHVTALSFSQLLLQRVLQWRSPKHNVSAMCRYMQNKSKQPLYSADYAEPSPHPPHTGAALHRRLQPLYTKKSTVSRSGTLPKTSPTQHSCNHDNAICTDKWQIRMYLHNNHNTAHYTWPQYTRSQNTRLDYTRLDYTTAWQSVRTWEEAGRAPPCADLAKGPTIISFPIYSHCSPTSHEVLVNKNK